MWKTIERPGYFGKKRDRLHHLWNQQFGEWFRGDHPMHVRWKESEGFKVNPGVVPFHLPDRIIPGRIKDYGGKGIWWHDKTIEDFYQRNKVLQVQE